MIVPRLLELPSAPDRSLFVWGPRKVGKSLWIREHLPSAPLVDLLKSEVYADFATRPALLRERYEGWLASTGRPDIVVIDEIQKVPALLDEVHWLIENRGARFLLTGSSARRLKRGHANLLGGRAWRRELRPFCLQEILPPAGGGTEHLARIAASGLLPPHFLSPDPQEDLRSYVADYLKEEIAHEGLTQSLPAFSDFLRVAALSSGELINYEAVARDVGRSAKIVRSYFSILEETLLSTRVPSWKRSPSRRMITTDKVYLFDVGVMNHLARRRPQPGTPELGKTVEHLVLGELLAYRAYRAPDTEVSYWRTSTGLEVDFVLNDRALAVEVKAASRVNPHDLRGLTALAEDGAVGRRVLVCSESDPRVLNDALGPVHVLPWRHFVQQLWNGELV